MKCNSCKEEATRKTRYFCGSKSPDTESSRLVGERAGLLSRFCPYEYECDVCDEHFLEAEFAIIPLECSSCKKDMLYALDGRFPGFCPYCGKERPTKIMQKCEKCEVEFEAVSNNGFFAVYCTACDPERAHGKLVD